MGPKILTVDDSKTIRLIINRAFRPYDCEVFEAGNGVEGLAVASRERPDLIILDLTMPIMDGYEALAKLKSDPELKNIPVVMLTAESGRENVIKIARKGVRDYLVKPFKDEMIVDRVSRIIDLKPRTEQAPKGRRFDDTLTILAVDDKPAIHTLLKEGLGDTAWKLHARVQPNEAVDFCNGTVPDIVMASLSLPENGAFTLLQMLRANAATKLTPVFAMCVKTATDDQLRAQQSGFNSIITKPIDFDDLKGKITRALNLDTSYRYFQNRDGLLVVAIPASFNQTVANEVTLQLRGKISESVDAGLTKVILDLSQVTRADITLIKLGFSVMQLCQEVGLKNRIVGTGVVFQECMNFEETRDWPFCSSFEEAAAALNRKEDPELVAA